MRFSKRGLLAGVIGGLLSPAALGLGLGEVDLRSNLNQPLAADIRLLQVRELGESEILVSLAAKEDFERAGVERPFFLTGLKFKVDLSNPDEPVIKVSSRKPVLEPYLNFLVELQWPTGRVVREYTLLMDLPVFAEDQSPVAVPVPSASKPMASPSVVREVAQPQPKPQSTQTQRPLHSAMQPSPDPDTYGPIDANDTLWDIALKVRPSRQVSVHQTMLAIQRKNPDAFIAGNINLLKRGSVLRVPTEDEITSFGGSEAVREVAAHNRRFRGESDDFTAAPLEGARREVESYDSDSDEGHLKLVAPEDVESSAAGKGAGSDSGDVEALQSELAMTMEELDRNKRENVDLRSNVAELEEQVATMERLLKVSDDKLRALELKLAGDGETSAQGESEALDTAVIDSAEEEALAQSLSAEAGLDTAISSTDDVSVETEVSQVEDGLTADEEDVVSSTDEMTEAQASTQEVIVEEPVAQPVVKSQPVKPAPRPAPRPEPGLLDMLMDNIALVGGALLALLIAIGAFIWKRKQDDGFEYDEDDSIEDSIDEVDLELAEGDLPEELEEEIESESSEEEASTEGGEEDDSDPLSYADIYIAYGKFDEAAQKLLSAIEIEPERADLRLKLLEVYAEEGSLDNFDPEYAGLLRLDDGVAAQQAADLRGRFTDADPFDADAYGVDLSIAEASAESDESNSLDDLDFGFDLNELDSSEGAAESSDSDILDVAEDDQAEEEFDLDALDLDFSSESSASDSGELDLDFNLPEDSDEGETAESGEGIDLELVENTLEPSDEDISLDEGLSFDLDENLAADVPESEGGNDGFELSEEFSTEASDDSEISALDAELDLDLDTELGLDTEQSDELSEAGSGSDDSLSDELASLDEHLDLSEVEAGVDSEDSFDLDADMGDLDLSELDAELDSLEGGEEPELGDLDDLDAELSLDDSDENTDELGESDELNLSDELAGLTSDEGSDAEVDLELSELDEALDLSLEDAIETNTEESLESLDSELGELSEASETLDLGDLEESLDLSMDDAVEGDLSAELPEESEDDAVLDLGDLDESLNLDLETDTDDGAEDGSTELASDENTVEDDDSLSLGDLDAALELDVEDALTDVDSVEEQVESDTETDALDLGELDEALELTAEDDLSADIQAPLDDLDLSADPETPTLISEEGLDLSSEGLEEEIALEDPSSEESDDLGSLAEGLLDEEDVAALGVDANELGAIDTETDELTDEEEFSFLSDSDEVSTKLDLARAYIDMGDVDGAKEILEEVTAEGNEEQRKEAEELLERSNG